MVELVAHPGPEPLRAIVTGAAEGIGAECARALAAAGAIVAVSDIDKVPLARLANEIGASAFACDVLSEHSVNQFVSQAFAALPKPDLLINAAGTGYVRALGMMRVSRAFAAAAAGRRATIVNIAAASGSLKPFGYAGSRQAFRRLSEGLGAALEEVGITVRTIESLEDEDAVAGLIGQLGRNARLPDLRSVARHARG